MISIFKKELQTYFSNAIGYIIIGIYLLLTGLFLWVIPGQFNVLDSGYANLDGLFYLAPWLFLFLCPAISMRFFSEEKITGTWELLITKPISKLNIVLGKFFAGWLVVFLALIPTLIYYFTTYYIAEPFGNIDSGAFFGSFIGLVFLAAVYISIGALASALSVNQIVSFIIAVVLSFFFYYGFEVLASFFSNAELAQFIESIGFHSHYKSISRGVLDSKDIAYFFSLTSVFVIFTVLRIKR